MNNGLFTAQSRDTTEDLFLESFGLLVPTTLGGQSVAVDDDGIPDACPSTVWSQGGGPCSNIDGSTVLSVVSAPAGSGGCPNETLAPTTPPKTATFKLKTLGSDGIVVRTLGWDQPPDVSEILLH